MSNGLTESSCPDFTSVVRAGLPVSSSSQGPGVRGQFLRDLDRVRKNQISKIDIVDIDVVFRNARSPVLGVGTASGDSFRSLRAAEQVVRATGGRCAAHALIVVAFAPGDMGNSEGRRAARPIYQRMDTDCFVCVGVIEDERLARGTIRMSALIG
jgi:cell division GTPase FtsZ